MRNYARILLGFAGLCALGLMGISYALDITAPFVLGTILSGGITILGIADAVTREADEE